MTQTAEVTQLPAVTRQTREVRVVNDPIAVLDTGRFEQMQRIATVMAHSNLVPDSLCKIKVDGAMVELPFETTMANCFLVVNQAVRWNMDPFAVTQSVSVVHGKLCYEGKLIAAVLEAKLGIRLKYKWDDKAGDQSGIEVSGTFPDGSTESISGTVADWKTTGTGSPWGAAKNFKRMLAYRGAREWCRLFAPGLMLGVLSDDEIELLADDRRTTTREQIIAPATIPPKETVKETVEVVKTEEPKEEAKAEVKTEVKAEPKVAETKTVRAPSPSEVEKALQAAGKAGPTGVPSMPSPKDDPIGFIEWLDQELGKTKNADEFATAWNDTIAPRIDELPPGFSEDAMVIYRQHETRLN